MLDPEKNVRWRKRRVIYNNDGDDVFDIQSSGKDICEDFLDVRSSQLIGSHVDSIFYCTCAAGLAFTHNTKEGHFINQGWPKRLVELCGRDDLQIQIDFCRKNGLEIFWSLRMNDAHDAYPAGSRRWASEGWHLSPFKLNHPEYLMGKPGDWEKYEAISFTSPRKAWTLLDYGFEEVRNHIFKLIAEVCRGYAVDGIELDFLRSPVFFTPTLDEKPVQQEHLDVMTELMQHIRDMSEDVGSRRGAPLLIAIRVPTSFEFSRKIGLDVENWLKDDVVDILIPATEIPSPLSTSFKNVVDTGHKYGVPVYPCVSCYFWNLWAWLDLGLDITWRGQESWIQAKRSGRIKSSSAIVRDWAGAVKAIRGAAMNIWDSNADGIYLFNFFPHLFSKYEVFSEIGDPHKLANLDKIYGIEYCEHRIASTSEEDVNVVLHFPVGENLQSDRPLKFQLYLLGIKPEELVTLRFNNNVVETHGNLRTVTSGIYLEHSLNSTYIKHGDNSINILLKEPDTPSLWVSLLIPVSREPESLVEPTNPELAPRTKPGSS